MCYGMVSGMVLVRLSGFGCLNMRYVSSFSDVKEAQDNYDIKQH